MGDCSNIDILQWNCRSILRNIDELIQHLSSNKFKVLLLQSINTSKNKLPHIPNFHYPPIYNQDESGKINTAIYIHRNIDYHPMKSPVPLTIPHVNASAAMVKFNSKLIVNVVSVYLPKGPDNDNTEWLQNLPDKEKWLIGGDFNSHSALWDHSCSRTTNHRFVENVVNSNLYLLNNGGITRIPDTEDHKPSAIDISFISPELAPDCLWEISSDTLGSDHFPIHIRLNAKMDPVDLVPDKIRKYDYDRADWDRFTSILTSTSTVFSENEDVDIMYDHFTRSVLHTADFSIPRSSCVSSSKYTGNLWWTDECESAKQEKISKYKAYLLSRSPSKHRDSKAAKLVYNKILAKAKREYWSRFCKEEVKSPSDSNKIWKKICFMKHGIFTPKYNVELENSKFPTSYQKAEKFADIFSVNSRLEGISEKCRAYRKAQEEKPEFKYPEADNNLYFNSSITLSELEEGISSLSNKRSAVGCDEVSNEMLKHLPHSWVVYLHKIMDKCWSEGKLPSVWKHSIIVPILKNGKPSRDVHSYRPISLTSHPCKLMEKIVTARLIHYCDKNNVIPVHQAGFRSGRSTTDHLVKLSTNIKRQFARRQNVLATFFDIKRAYDQVWHAQLLNKLKKAGICGRLFSFIKDFLSNRTIETRVEKAYSSQRGLHMGVPQGSIIAPLLFSIMISDLSKKISKSIKIVQYADDICIWLDAKLKNISNRKRKQIQTFYQSELDKISAFLSENGLALSVEKTHMMVFSAGDPPRRLPSFFVDGVELQFKDRTKFLGVFFTSKLSWKFHIENSLTKAQKSLNLLKIISRQNWGKETKSLSLLATALVRSKLTYGQEVYFSAPKYFLKKLQSIDSRAYKLALGVPIHTPTIATYEEVGVLSLNDYRRLSSAKYIVRSGSIENVNVHENVLRSDLQFPKRARTINCLTTVATYTSDIQSRSGLNSKDIAKRSLVSPIPPWELIRANFDLNNDELKKSDNPHLLAASFRSRVHSQYPNHLKVYTDGSLTDNNMAGAGFVIPGLKKERSFHIGKDHSIFTAELVAILMALRYIVNLPMAIFQILFCVDSKSVLFTLKSMKSRDRCDLVIEINYLIHFLFQKGSCVTFTWVPSHCGIYGNEWADRVARGGAKERPGCEIIHIPLSVQECYNLLEKHSKDKAGCIVNQHTSSMSLLNGLPREISSLCFRLKYNSLKCKHVHSAKCVCGEKLLSFHVLFNCPSMKQYMPDFQLPDNPTNDDFKTLTSNHSFLANVSRHLIRSPIGTLI